MTTYLSAARPETAADATRRAVLAWLDHNPDLPVRYTYGDSAWATAAGREPTAWHVHIDTIDTGLRICGIGPRHNQRPTVITEPQPLSGRLAAFGNGIVFNQILDRAVHDTLAAVTHARRAATPSHRRPR